LLAANTRRLLGLGEKEPVPSMKRLIEKELGIPVVQEKLAERFAGATIANGRDRGIVVNEAGQNSNVFVRMTMAHELGHLLWDPDDRLNRLKVDQYDELQTDYVVGKGAASKKDPFEIRTNAFAIGFLAPPAGVRSIADRNMSAIDVLTTVMVTYGISATAAKYHIQNVGGHDVSAGAMRDLPNPSDEWVAAENMMVDWFPLKETPISRRSRFAVLVAQAFRKGYISGDTASLYLRSTEADFRRRHSVILQANQ
jgi:Zn-dependent peptidase ImmA (M78 family)